ncbi:hypothetical protein LJR235_004665 [Pararhizobium sp. LjRoot235]|uniref:carbamoyltransferase family protein n=1 Tax=Pararhizobium sp. LjRoot235 TaxID=3342291 RepID=UPI003ECF82A0
MNILGLNYIFHDASACVISNNEIKCAIEEERLSREKHTSKFPVRAIARCLKQANLTLDEIDHIAISVNPDIAVAKKVQYAASLGAAAREFLYSEIGGQNQKHLAFWNWYNHSWPVSKARRPDVHFVDHHYSHAIGSFHVSPWTEAAVLAIDGGGEWRTVWMGEARNGAFSQFSETLFPHSLGTFYSAVTEYCGFKVEYDEGKTMGLAPTGDPTRFFDIVDEMVRVKDDGAVELDLSWFDLPASITGRFCSEKLIAALGVPRGPGEEIREHHRDAAAAFQAVLEKNVLKMTSMLAAKTKLPFLVHSGGVALNSVANGKILQAGHFDDIYVMPGAGDNGTAIGAAAYVYKDILGNREKLYHVNPFVGDEYANQEIERFLKSAKVTYRKSDDVCLEAARSLSDGKIIGWFQGKMEFGPRALGGRSILADPTRAGMKDKINAEVKHREAFRPFAPSVIAERASDYFETTVEVPFMLTVFPVREEMRAKIPAIVHVDDTARLQTVRRDCNERYYDLIREFGKLSGHPVVLNTSFNVMDEPIVASPSDAVRCFYSTGIDILYIGDFVLEKEPAKATHVERSIQVPQLSIHGGLNLV